MSTTIAEALSRLSTIKSNIRTALANKGATGTDSMNMADFPTAISNLSTGTRIYTGTILQNAMTESQPVTIYVGGDSSHQVSITMFEFHNISQGGSTACMFCHKNFAKSVGGIKGIASGAAPTITGSASGGSSAATSSSVPTNSYVLKSIDYAKGIIVLLAPSNAKSSAYLTNGIEWTAY